MSKRIDLIGKRFGKLVVIDKSMNNKNTKFAWLCICDCGNFKKVESSNLTTGNTKSCGCYGKETTKNINYKHGMCGTKIYTTWLNMKSRCQKESNDQYYNYGKKGITVCNEWENFEVFYKDMGDLPSKIHQIDRIDNSKGYYKENCRWATPSENSCNKEKLLKNKSGYKGVSKRINGKFQSSISKNKNRYYLGTYDNEKDAALAYDNKAKEIHGEFANLNFKY